MGGLTVGIGLSIVNLKLRLRRLWRRITGRCIRCGRRRANHFDCLHCSKGDGCHPCGKNMNFALLYGASASELGGYLS